MFPKIWTVAIVVSVTLAAAAQRLPHTAVPEHYQLTFTPHFDNNTFSGEESLQIRVLQPGASVVLNAAEVEFQKAEISSSGVTQAATVTPDAAKEQATLTVSKPLAAGPAKLHILYTGHLNDQMRGLYLSTENGRKYAVSQFEATDARRAFPSFDEPSYKATFDIAAVIPNDNIAISNGSVASDVPGPTPDQHTVRFTTTPKMSSYLAALAIGDFKCLEGSSDGIPIRVCGTPEKYQLGGFALEAAQQVMHFYNQYFAIKYPYKKLDFIGVPDFSAGAMENTACIISRDQFLFADPQRSTPDDLRNAAEGAVAHEMAHQWFGDLVTMQWWNDSWLNEGLATWMESKPIEQWKPDWNVAQDRVLETAWAMNRDSLRSVHPIKVDVESPAEIMQIFDSIIYSKAAAMLRMVEGYLTPEVFRSAINAYLQKYAYGNASAEDFWNTMAAASKKPVDRILSSFIVQPGVPLVTVHAQCEQDREHLTVSQQRYTYDRPLLNSGMPEQWIIPMCVRASSESCTLLDKRQATDALPGCGPVYGNAGARGYYRTAYDPEDFRKLAASAETALTAPERIMLVADAWAAVRVDREDVGNFLTLAQDLDKDRSRALMQLLDADLRYIGDYLLTDADQWKYQLWLRGVLGPILDDVGWNEPPSDSEEQRSLRADVFLTLGMTARDPRALSDAHAIVQHDLQGQQVNPTLAEAALRVAARNGDEALFEQVLARLKSAPSPDYYLRHLMALTEFADPKVVQRVLEFGLSSQVRSQDAIYIYIGMLQNPVARKQAWDFIREHWQKVEEKLGENSIAWVVETTGSFCDSGSRQQVQAFYAEHKVPSAARAVQNALERIEYCSDLRTQQRSKLATWLDGRVKTQTGQ